MLDQTFRTEPFLNDYVSPSNNVREDDTIATKTALNRIGKYDPPDWGISGTPDQRMFDGLEKFQRESGLTPDRAMRPGGPTHRTLHAALDQRKATTQPKPLKLNRAVGETADNQPDDVGKVRASLAGLNYLPKTERTRPKTRMDSQARSALGTFQMDYNLKWDRLARPDGPTITALDRVTRPQRRVGKIKLPTIRSTETGTPVVQQDDLTQTADWKPRTPLEAARQAHLRTLGDLLRRGQPLNEPDEMLGETVLESFGDRVRGLTAPQAAKLFKLTVHADEDPAARDALDAVADPDFPVRRARIMLGDGQQVEVHQDELIGASGDRVRLARVDRPGIGSRQGEVWSPGLLFGGVLSGTARYPARAPNVSSSTEDEPDENTESQTNPNLPATVEKGGQATSPTPPPDDDEALRRRAQAQSAKDMVDRASDQSKKKSGNLVVETFKQIENDIDRAAQSRWMERSRLDTRGQTNSYIANMETDMTEAEGWKEFNQLAEMHGQGIRKVGPDRWVFETKDGIDYTFYPRSSGSRKGIDAIITVRKGTVLKRNSKYTVHFKYTMGGDGAVK